MAEAQKIAGGNGSETDIAEAKIELEVCSESSVKEKVLTISRFSRASRLR